MLRRKRIVKQMATNAHVWPINSGATRLPPNWSGWPGQKQFALILTHDVETARGQMKCRALMNLEMELGFRSSFNFVPERYRVSPELRALLTHYGFEVGVHGLKHDGKLYKSEKIFKQRAIYINRYLKAWNAVGFRSPAMHHNLQWLHQLNIDYDASTFDTDPFEPQPDGVKTIFPFSVMQISPQHWYVELPYTLPQDSTLFIFMQEHSINIWKEKLAWIAEHGGMALVITHPDYMNFSGTKFKVDEYPAQYYAEFLQYIHYYYQDQYWQVLPKELSRFWLNSYSLKQKTEIAQAM